MRTYIIFVCIALISFSQSASSDEFGEAMDAMFELQITNETYIYKQSYIDYVVEYGKLDEYQIDGADNYTELLSHYETYIESDHFVNQLNRDYPELITVYKMVDGNATDQVDYTETVYLYNHTYFSDILEEDRWDYAMDLSYANSSYAEDSLSDDSDLCTIISAVPSEYKRSYINLWCQGVQNQGRHDTCWAFASTAQAECNYGLAKDTHTAFSVCWDISCSKAGDSTGAIGGGGGWPTKSNLFYENYGACKSSGYTPTYDGCLEQMCESCGHIKQASGCNIYLTGSPAENFRSANRLLSTSHNALSFGIKFGKDFWNFNGSVPTSSICNEGPFGYHAMTAIGTEIMWDHQYGSLRVKNSWGTGWGDDGYFWLSKEAYEECDGQQLSWNTFPTSGEVDEEEGDGVLSHKMVVNVYITLIVLCFCPSHIMQ
eukprot:9285_1